MYANWSSYKKVTNDNKNLAIVSYVDPNFGTNGATEAGDSTRVWTNSPGLNNRAYRITAKSELAEAGAYWKLGTRPALYG